MPLGLELRTRPYRVQSLLERSSTETAGWIVEFVGTRGIGKSTLNNLLDPHLRRRWFTRTHLSLLGPGPKSLAEIEAVHRDICLDALNRAQKEGMEPWTVITMLRQMGLVVGESLTIASHDFPRGFFLDEGLFKNFPREVLGLPAEAAAPLWRNRAFVYLRTGDPELALRRYQRRSSDRENRGMPLSMVGDEVVRERIGRDTVIFERLLDRARDLGRPFITISAEDSTAENVAKVLDFEAGLRSGAATTPSETS